MDEAEIKSHIKSLTTQLYVMRNATLPRLENKVIRLRWWCLVLTLTAGVMALSLALH